MSWLIQKLACLNDKNVENAKLSHMELVEKPWDANIIRHRAVVFIQSSVGPLVNPGRKTVIQNSGLKFKNP